MAKKRVNTTKYEIIQTATRLFLEKGYSATPPKRICEELGISTGNMTYYFPTKEHLLAVLVEMLCNFQVKTLQNAVEQEGATSLLAVCLELATMAAMSEENPIAKDLFVAAYTNPLSLEIIRKNDAKRSRFIYAPFCRGWTDMDYAQAETLVSGIEYATMMTTGDSAPLAKRISGALNQIMQIYGVPRKIREQNIRHTLYLDYRLLGETVLDQFKKFVEETNEHTFEMLVEGGKITSAL